MALQIHGLVTILCKRSVLPLALLLRSSPVSLRKTLQLCSQPNPSTQTSVTTGLTFAPGESVRSMSERVCLLRQWGPLAQISLNATILNFRDFCFIACNMLDF